MTDILFILFLIINVCVGEGIKLVNRVFMLRYKSILYSEQCDTDGTTWRHFMHGKQFCYLMYTSDMHFET